MKKEREKTKIVACCIFVFSIINIYIPFRNYWIKQNWIWRGDLLSSWRVIKDTFDKCAGRTYQNQGKDTLLLPLPLPFFYTLSCRRDRLRVRRSGIGKCWLRGNCLNWRWGTSTFSFSFFFFYVTQSSTLLNDPNLFFSGGLARPASLTSQSESRDSKIENSFSRDWRQHKRNAIVHLRVGPSLMNRWLIS